MLADSPVVTVHVPPQLRSLAGGHAEILASGDTVAEVLEAAAHGYPAMRGHLVAADGALAPGLEVYLGGRSVSEMQGLKTPIELEELVSIVPTGYLAGESASGDRQSWQAGQGRPLDGVEHVLHQQAEFGVPGDLQFAVEEERVRVFLAGEQLEVGRQIGGESQVGLAIGPEDWAKRAISIGE